MKTGVFLLNMGGPDSIEAIQPFLENLFSDPEILRFPLSGLLQKPLARFISKKRAAKVAGLYAAMGGKSPQVEITADQVKALQLLLGDEYVVKVAMRYWYPFASEAVGEMKEAGVDRLVILPLYPHYSRATTGSSIKDLREAIIAGGLGKLPHVVIDSWEDFEPYIDAVAETLKEVVTGHHDTTVVFSAHGLPQRLIDEGDPYLSHIKATVASVMDRFAGMKHKLAFQSRTGPVKWLSPSMEEMLKKLAAAHVTDVTVVAISFVSDHIETLQEIDVEYREMASKLGITKFRRAPALNIRPAFIRALASCVRQAEASFQPPVG